MQVAAVALVGLAAAAAAASWYALGAIVLGLVFACAAARQSGHGEASGWAGHLSRGVRAAAGTARIALLAAVFAAYLFAEATPVAAPVFVLAVTVADVAGLRIDGYYRRWLSGLLLAATAVLLAVCLTISPAQRPAMGPVPGLGGLSLATAIATVLFTGPRARGGSTRDHYVRSGTAALAVLAVAAAAMYQIGPVRFGLSATSLRDVVVASDARSLLPVLAAAVVLATIPAALTTLRHTRRGLSASSQEWRGRAGAALPCAVLAGGLAGLLEPLSLLLVVAALVLLEALVAVVLRSRERRSVPGPVVAIAAVVLLAGVGPVYVLIGVVLAALGVLGARVHPVPRAGT